MTKTLYQQEHKDSKEESSQSMTEFYKLIEFRKMILEIKVEGSTVKDKISSSIGPRNFVEKKIYF